MSSLLQSRKFWIMIMDIVVTLVTYFVTKYASPSAVDDVIKVLITLQPAVLMVIYSIAKEDVARLAAGVHPLQLRK
jgi:hypothetical protein